MPIMAYAAYTDIKTRRADNRLWYIIGVIGLFINILNFNMFMLFTISTFFVLAMVGFYFIKMGGADAKAMLSLSIMYPLNPFGLIIILLMACMLSMGGALFRTSWVKSIPFLLPLAISYLCYNMATLVI
jgi:Flp pilus assembly protein protease CpaA